ncbi:unannotated protein [freshwater metagenome]|uniref:Unannotated protein n=1 Tax=freshwater metagenome TaxID=449393 RepID=A0A6J7GB16_9ZZZZ
MAALVVDDLQPHHVEVDHHQGLRATPCAVHLAGQVVEPGGPGPGPGEGIGLGVQEPGGERAAVGGGQDTVRRGMLAVQGGVLAVLERPGPARAVLRSPGSAPRQAGRPAAPVLPDRRGLVAGRRHEVLGGRHDVASIRGAHELTDPGGRAVLRVRRGRPGTPADVVPTVQGPDGQPDGDARPRRHGRPDLDLAPESLDETREPAETDVPGRPRGLRLDGVEADPVVDDAQPQVVADEADRHGDHRGDGVPCDVGGQLAHGLADDRVVVDVRGGVDVDGDLEPSPDAQRGDDAVDGLPQGELLQRRLVHRPGEDAELLRHAAQAVVEPVHRLGVAGEDVDAVLAEPQELLQRPVVQRVGQARPLAEHDRPGQVVVPQLAQRRHLAPLTTGTRPALEAEPLRGATTLVPREPPTGGAAHAPSLRP